MIENPINKLNKYLKDCPKKAIIIRENEKLTYEDVENYSNYVANRIGFDKTQKYIGFYLKDTIYTLGVYMAIYKLGGTPVPLTNSMPLMDSYQRMDDVNFNILLTDDVSEDVKKLSTRIRVIKLPQINKTDIKKEKLKYHVPFPHIVNLLPTSGTTGKPKKVQVTLKNLNWIMREYQKHYDLDSSSRMLCMTDYSWDVSMPEIMAPIYIGATSFVLPKNLTGLQKTSRLAEFTKKYSLTFLSLSPSYTFSIAKMLNARNFESVKTLVLGGENFSIQLVPLLKKIFPKETRIFNLYGPTEATVAIFTYEIKGDETDVVPIGKKYDGVKFKVLNEDNTPVQEGVLYVGGECLTDGYTDQELNESHFVIIDGDRYYNTGDIVYYDESGNLVFVGRIDDQISYHGSRIELREIEETIRLRTGINEVVSVFEKNKLVAFLHCEEDVDEVKVKEKISKIFPPHYHVIPIFVEEFFFNDHSKIDKKKMMSVYYYKNNTIDIKKAKYSDVVKEFDALLLDFGFRDFNEMDSLDKVRFLIEFEDTTKVKIPEELIPGIVNNKSFKDMLVNLLDDNQRDKESAKELSTKDDSFFIEQLEDYSEFLSFGEKTETGYLAKNYKQRNYRSYFIFDIKLNNQYSQVRHIIKQNLKELANHIDIVKIVLDDNNAERFSMIENYTPYIFKVYSFPEETVIKNFFEKEKSPLFIPVINTKENILRFYISHYIMDLSSYNLLAKIIYDIENINFKIDYNSNFLEFIKYIKNNSNSYKIDDATRLLPKSFKVSSISKNKIQVIEENFYVNYNIFNKPTSYALQAFYQISKKMFKENEQLKRVTGSIICDIRNFVDFDAEKIIGDIHSTLPIWVDKSESMDEMFLHFREILSLYQNGVNLKEIAFENGGEILRRWENVNFAINFLGETSDSSQMIECVKNVNYDEHHVVVMSDRDKYYIVFSSEIFKEADFSCQKSEENF
ncbi:TPA: AMP-binding protein [Streptococcus agalactiae]|nr:AMP-binding protein [Streptococcus agalactiae]HEO6603065.1 AMP-binding protein [Streptococcus agalactiae]HEO6610908.1 AMP-binding protein [Streptococcus agalactiae]HEO6614847.1 AMP-binding protein [Streptococcus agalactiae]HEO6618871.1 AMP-binding protein [Streptococcus agalactiae]